MIVIPFRVSIEPERQDPQLASKLKAELPGIFNWAVDGLRDLQRQRQFTVPTICREAWEQFRAESNPTREFLTDHFEVASTEQSIPCADVYAEYVSFIQSQRLKALDMTTFGKELRKLFPTAERRRDGGGERLWKYHGLRRAVTTKPTFVAEA
jgi:putative DNA primase/helicase